VSGSPTFCKSLMLSLPCSFKKEKQEEEED